jgi:hypothetical protein
MTRFGMNVRVRRRRRRRRRRGCVDAEAWLAQGGDK